MKSLEARQAERAERRAAEDEARKASGAPDTSDEAGETDKPKAKRGKGPTTLNDAGIEGGVNPQGGNGGGAGGGGAGGGNPFGNN